MTILSPPARRHVPVISLYRRDHIDFDAIMIKCLDNGNTYRSYPTMDQVVGVEKQEVVKMSKNELISTACLKLLCDFNSSLKYDCNSGE
jgi:hypothetical protein